MAGSPSPSEIKPVSRGRGKMFLVLAVCALPVIASYVTYYLIRPSTRSNYGDLIEPQRPLPRLNLRTLDGRPYESEKLKGQWLMLTVDAGACEKACEDKMYHIRQVRLTTGKDRDRVERIWLVTDEAPLSTMLMRQYDGMQMLRADRAELAEWLPTIASEPVNGAGRAGIGGVDTIEDHIYVVDPLGNLMMRFPREADPNKTKKDLARLLRASSIG